MRPALFTTTLVTDLDACGYRKVDLAPELAMIRPASGSGLTSRDVRPAGFVVVEKRGDLRVATAHSADGGMAAASGVGVATEKSIETDQRVGGQYVF
jgi:hypothetical protein